LDAAIAQRSPNASSLGSNQAVATFTDRFGRPCKVYAERIKVDGNTESVWATICRRDNGQWALAH
jgi:surface antigen